MGTYVTDAGFLKPTLAETKINLQERFRLAFGADTDTGDTTPAGLLIGELAKALSDATDADQEVFASLDANSATGVSLDRIGALTGITRISAAAARASVVCYANGGHLGLVLTPGRQVRRVRGGLVLSLLESLTISLSACREIYTTYPAAVAGGSYTLVTSLGSYTVAIPGGTADPAGYLYTHAATLFNAGQTTSGAVARHAYGTESDNMAAAECLQITSPATVFSFTAGAWTTLLVGSAGLFVATATGAQDIAIGEISEIVTTETGWLYARNLVLGVSGRDIETDEAYRMRRSRSFREGYATEDAIRQSLLSSVEGIIAAEVISNRTLSLDVESRPAKSFECIVDGGTNEEVAAVIWRTQPAGIESHGVGALHTYYTPDSQGYLQTVKFSRPQQKILDVKITYSVYAEEDFPGVITLTEYILAWAATEYKLGKDVIAGRIAGAAYRVPGVGSAAVEVRWHGSSYGAGPLVVASRERAVLLLENITVVTA